MICITKQYFNWNRVLLLPMGLWPDEETKFTRFRASLFYCLLMSNIAFQLSRLFFAEFSFDFVIKILSFSAAFCTLAIFFMSFWINMETMKYLLHQLQHIYDGLKNQNEIAIYEKYGYIGKCISARLTSKNKIQRLLSEYLKISHKKLDKIGKSNTNCLLCLTSMFTVCTICGLFFNFIIIYSPFILDVVIPKNESYAIFIMKMVTKHFVVSEKYYFLIIVHVNAAFSVGMIVLTGTGTMMISYFKYACGMFEITSYRIEQAMAIELLRNTDIKKEIVIYRGIICAVDIHRTAMEFAKCFITKTEVLFFLLVIAGVLCLSCNLFRLCKIESPMEEVEQVLLHFIAVILILAGTFLANYVGQELMDYNNHVYVTTYNVSWYLAPVDIQKLILFLIQRSSRIFCLTVGGLFTASLECFATVKLFHLFIHIVEGSRLLDCAQ
ncbi:uncharacterized protein LOC105285790 isoform X1 [Ooceraea biroi]|uniref:uncharacterized protein LOC105285790 isoform X1 n=2 Tax=Ooceraea biroi TaxID=2015173 RepID=UPI000F087405|nr:uncharacterized protein LOC105285790 isoform X1 [Ooceraea biroi]